MKTPTDYKICRVLLIVNGCFLYFNIKFKFGVLEVQSVVGDLGVVG